MVKPSARNDPYYVGSQSVKPSARISAPTYMQDSMPDDWDPYSAIPGYYDLEDLTVFKDGEWIYGKDAYRKPYRVDTGGTRKTGQRIFRTEIPTRKQGARAAFERRQQEALDEIARRREKLAQEQVNRMERLEARAQAISAKQSRTVDRLKKKQTKRLDRIENASAEKRRRIRQRTRRRARRITAAGNAAADSLRILGQEQPRGPSAIQTPRNQRTRGAGVTKADVERGSAASRGTNLSI